MGNSNAGLEWREDAAGEIDHRSLHWSLPSALPRYFITRPPTIRICSKALRIVLCLSSVII